MSASSALAASTGGGRLSSGRLPSMDIAPAGQTARQCWHFQQPFQPKESKSAMRGAPPSRLSTAPGHTLTHSPQAVHLSLSTSNLALFMLVCISLRLVVDKLCRLVLLYGR